MFTQDCIIYARKHKLCNTESLSNCPDCSSKTIHRHEMLRGKKIKPIGKQVLRWACLARAAATSIRIVLIDQEARFPLQVKKLLRASPYVEGCCGCHVLRPFPCKSYRKECPPVTGRLLEHCAFIDDSGIWQWRCPPQECTSQEHR